MYPLLEHDTKISLQFSYVKLAKIGVPIC